MVEIINPEFLMTLLNLSECKKENSNNTTSTSINIVKKSSKNILLISLISVTILGIEMKLSYSQCPRLYIDKAKNTGTKQVAIAFFRVINFKISGLIMLLSFTLLSLISL